MDGNNVREERLKLSIERCTESLVHACHCNEASCSLPSCKKMKKVVLHTTFCKRKKKGKCRLCNQLLALSCFHAKKCRDRKCLVPYCLGFTLKSVGTESAWFLTVLVHSVDDGSKNHRYYLILMLFKLNVI